ncbi:hypothetical protein ERJ75_001355700 [Trypanosoma vivax]|uniref:Uncharacterized protein n=1 Tax=Trypanosoma vivax (strain Y486) TaxID=1055687 RepID=G0UCT5_TRYVY|nr:hypothetical protein TRVL_02335 [Trypanosoma vivax]KAH8607877.1 hypothetical protein ERJ75_001355700 [Trypanosoma vivax]CCC53645.1 conserved hypothetical protein [Trypanosoma vivax Y486]
MIGLHSRSATVSPDKRFNSTVGGAQTSDARIAECKPIGFIAVNRVVAVLKKAIDRLELLSLVDTTAPDGGAGDSPDRNAAGSVSKSPAGGTGAASTTSNGRDRSRGSTPRRAAVIKEGAEGLSQRALRDVNAALRMAAEKERTIRPTVADLVEEQKRLERRYAELLQKTVRMNPNPNEPLLDPSCFANVQDSEELNLMEELKQTSKRLREHNKILFTRLKDNPNDYDNWKKVSNERAELLQLLQSVVKDLTAGYASARPPPSRLGPFSRRGSRVGLGAAVVSDNTSNDVRDANVSIASNRFGSSLQLRRSSRNASASRIPLTSSFERFAKLIANEQSAQKWADELVLKEKELNQNVKQLQQELKLQKQLKEKDVSELRQRVSELKAQLREEKKNMKQQSDIARFAAEAAHEAIQRIIDGKEQAVNEAMQLDASTQSVEMYAHQAFKDHLLERTAAMDDLAMQWDKKNQSEVKRAEARKIDLEQMRQQCAERLQKAREDRESEQQLKQKRDTERSNEEASKIAEELRRNNIYEAVSKIQSTIRAMFTRQALTVLKKKALKKKRAAEKK